MLPFLKWVGGKRWLVERHSNLFPEEFGKYFEPFLGGGAVYFALSPKRSVLSDANAKLISCYTALRDDPALVLKELKKYARQHSDEFYYLARDERPSCGFKEAARFIYLNRTCFNGIYRENLKGKFNVPRGTKNSIIFPADDFCAVAQTLKGAKLQSADFSETISEAGEGDFVFVDPPYTVRHNNNGFIKYNQRIFTWADQQRLRDDICAAKKRGVKCLVTNADHSSIRKLYEGIGKPITLKRPSVVAGGTKGRGDSTEIAFVVGYAVVEHGGRKN